jgi:hypothetical protein
MHNFIGAPRAGVIAEVCVAAGQAVGHGDPIVRFARELTPCSAPTNIGLLLQGITHVTPQSRGDDRRWPSCLLYLGVGQALRAAAAAAHRRRLPAGQPAAEPADRRGRHAARALRHGHRQRTVPAAHLHRHRRAHRLRPAAGEPAPGAAGRSRAVRHLPDAAARAGLLGFTPPKPRRSASSAPSTGPRRSTSAACSRRTCSGPITVAAYSYMSLVPIILPPIMKLLTTQSGAPIRMPYSRARSAGARASCFPIVVTARGRHAGALRHAADRHADARQPDEGIRRRGAPDQGFLERDRQHRDLFLGLAIGSTMVGAEFLKKDAVHPRARPPGLRLDGAGVCCSPSCSTGSAEARSTR